MVRFHAPASLALILLGILAACETPSAPGGDPEPTAKTESASKNAETDASRFTGKGVVDLSALLNESPDSVEALLGKPTDTGTQRISCVRFVPERTFFACKQEARFYAHPQLERLVVEYEDGLSANVSLIGLRGEGEFSPDKALALAGLSLPGTPRETAPTFGLGDDPDQKVQAWDWFNSQSRLLVDGLQFRVRVSVVNGDWKRSKVEVINNNPLDDEQRKRVRVSKSDPGVSEDPGVAGAPAP